MRAGAESHDHVSVVSAVHLAKPDVGDFLPGLECQAYGDALSGVVESGLCVRTRVDDMERNVGCLACR